jgi:16S rRNA (guanine966-N2)-methyltransferase
MLWHACDSEGSNDGDNRHGSAAPSRDTGSLPPMRIVAGERKGMRLDAPAGRETRPTSDRLRETLFSVLGDVSALRVLDPFAGSGALGLEALSRGAARAEFCDTSSAALRALRANVERLGYGDRAGIRRQDARRRLAADAAAGETYQLILLDPPYRMLAGLQEDFSLHLPRLLVTGGLAVVESAAGEPPPAIPLRLDTTRVQSAARLTVYRHA